MKRIIIFLLCVLTKGYAQTYEFKYECKREFNSNKYNLIQQFDEKKYAYTIEKIFEESIGSNESKASLTIYLDPETLKTEKMKLENKDYFISELEYYQEISADRTFTLDVEFIPNHKTKEVELKVKGKTAKYKIDSYTLQLKSNQKALYEVWFLDNLTLNHNMPYNKKQLMFDWTTIFYAYKNSKMNKIIYAIQQISKDKSEALNCKLLYIDEIEE